MLPHSRVRDPPRGARPHLRSACHICDLRQQSQRLGAFQHASVEAPEREQPRLASPAATQRDDRGGNASVRPRFEPAHVDIPQTREEALVLLEQLQQVRAQRQCLKMLRRAGSKWTSRQSVHGLSLDSAMPCPSAFSAFIAQLTTSTWAERSAFVAHVMAQSRGNTFADDAQRTLTILRVQQDTAQWGTEEGINLVAFGGGVASTLAAFLVHSVFEDRCAGVFGVGRRTTEGQLQRARTLAECLGASLSSVCDVLLLWPTLAF